jgi:hypothetical protein
MSRRLSFIISLVLLQSAAMGTARSQTFYFNDGRKASMPEARIKGTNIVIPMKIDGVDGGSAEISLAISTLKRIEWPVPEAVAQAEDDLKAGKPADALKKVDPILREQEPLREVPGSWWAQGAVVKAVALARLGKDVDADVMLELMRRAKADPEAIARGELAIIDQLVASGKADAAKARLDKIQDGATDDSSLAAIALTKGQIFERAGRTEDALLSYLRVPVYYPTEDAKMPAALLGAIRALRKLNDEPRAAALLETLTTRYPNSPEAAQAKR